MYSFSLEIYISNRKKCFAIRFWYAKLDGQIAHSKAPKRFRIV